MTLFQQSPTSNSRVRIAHTQHVDACDTRWSESRRPDRLQAGHNATKNLPDMSVAEQTPITHKRPHEFTVPASKRPRLLSRDTSDEGHGILTPADGSQCSADDNSNEQPTEESSASIATDPTEDGNLTEAIADIVQNQQTDTTGERAISLSQKPYLIHGSRTQVTSPAPSHGSLFPDESVSSADRQQSSEEPRQSVSSATGLTRDEAAAPNISAPSTELMACIENHGKCSWP